MTEAVEFKEYTSIQEADMRGDGIAVKMNKWLKAHPGAAVAAMNTVVVDGDLVSVVVFEWEEEEK